jgi:tripartite-type tricarboxylate transporter receptor subunit TctC
VIVENLGGVSGAIAAQKVLNAPADGHYVFQGSPNELILSPLANAAVKFKSEDFRLVQMIGAAQMGVYARPDIPAKNMEELIEYARKGAKEGKPLTYASVGPGSFYHLLGEQFSKLTGIPMTHVPYKGGAPANQDLIGGQVDIFITVYGKSYQQLADSGKIKILAMLNNERLEGVKQIPAISETPQLKNFTFNIWTGYFVKKDTPEPVVQALHKAITASLSDPAVREGLETNSLLVAKPASLNDVAKVYADGTAQFRAIAKSINLQPQ